MGYGIQLAILVNAIACGEGMDSMIAPQPQTPTNRHIGGSNEDHPPSDRRNDERSDRGGIGNYEVHDQGTIKENLRYNRNGQQIRTSAVVSCTSPAIA